MMHITKHQVRIVIALFITLTFARATEAQSPVAPAAGVVYHRIEGRIQQRNRSVDNIQVRLFKMPEMQPVGDTFTRQDGQFMFQRIPTGDYLVETFETEKYEATQTSVSVYPRDLLEPRPTSATVFIDLPLKSSPARVAPGEVSADVDLDVPKKALKHYKDGMKKLEKRESAQGITELQTAIEMYPTYYAARLELGRELRLRKRFQEALEIIQPLMRIAPRRAEPHIEHGIILLALERREESVNEFNAALRLGEANWAAHLYLGWALLEQDGTKAEAYFQRALKLDEEKAARAHLALARLAEAKGERLLALDHLDAYLSLAPQAHDAEATRKLAERLRSQN